MKDPDAKENTEHSGTTDNLAGPEKVKERKEVGDGHLEISQILAGKLNYIQGAVRPL